MSRRGIIMIGLLAVAACGDSRREKLIKAADELCECESEACRNAIVDRIEALTREMLEYGESPPENYMARVVECAVQPIAATNDDPAPAADTDGTAGDESPTVAEQPTGEAMAMDTLLERIRATELADEQFQMLVRDLAGRGAAAREHLLALARDSERSKAQRDEAGVLYAQSMLFRPDELRDVAGEAEQAKLAAAAAHSLALNGGPDNRAALEAIAKRFAGKDDELVEMVQTMLEAMPETQRLTDHQLMLLDRMYASRDRDTVMMSAAALATDHAEALRWGLERMKKLPMERDHQLSIIAIERQID